MKKDILDKILGAVAGIIYVVLFLAWPFGIYHAFDRHGPWEGALSVVFVVPAYWYSAEYFWHEEEWEEVYATNSEILIHLMVSEFLDSVPAEKQAEMIKVKGEVREWVQEMPESERIKLKQSSIAFANFYSSREMSALKIFIDENATLDSLLDEQIRLVGNGSSGIENEQMKDFFVIPRIGKELNYVSKKFQTDPIVAKLDDYDSFQKNEFFMTIKAMREGKRKSVLHLIEKIFAN